MTANKVCLPCRLDEHMVQPRDHPRWDGEESAGRMWAPEDRCTCSCAQEPVQKRIVTLDLPPMP
jgi:hypothetical protein